MQIIVIFENMIKLIMVLMVTAAVTAGIAVGEVLYRIFKARTRK
jgi:hypothetical protein